MTLQAGGQDTATSALTLLTSGTANVKGDYVQLISALGFAARGIWIDISNGSAIGSQIILDIAADAAGGTTYLVVIPDLWVPNARDFVRSRVFIPKSFTSGSSIAARIQSAGSGVTCTVAILLDSQGQLPTIASITALNVSTSGATNATSIDPGGVANTKGGYTEIIPSTAEAYDGLIVVAALDNTTVGAAQNWLVDIATGAAASEVVAIPNLHFLADTARDGIINPNAVVPISIPISTRLSANPQCDSIDATDRLIDDFAIYGYVNNRDARVPRAELSLGVM